jgi:DNA repair protein RadC
MAHADTLRAHYSPNNKLTNTLLRNTSALLDGPVPVPKIQLSYSLKTKSSQLPKISCAQDAYNILLTNWNTSTLEFVEQFKVILLNRANKVIGVFKLSTGGTVGTIAEPKLVFASCILANASGLILAHNHPSGNLKPSQADIALTKKLREAGKILEIQVLDHLIVTSEGYYSFADEGLI